MKRQWGTYTKRSGQDGVVQVENFYRAQTFYAMDINYLLFLVPASFSL